MKINQHGLITTYFVLVRSQLFYATWLVALGVQSTHGWHNKVSSECITLLEYSSNGCIATVCNCILHFIDSCSIICLLLAPLVVLTSFVPRGRPRSHRLAHH